LTYIYSFSKNNSYIKDKEAIFKEQRDGYQEAEEKLSEWRELSREKVNHI